MRHIDKMLQHLARTMNRIAVLSSACFLPPILILGSARAGRNSSVVQHFVGSPRAAQQLFAMHPILKSGGRGGEEQCNIGANARQKWCNIFSMYGTLSMQSYGCARDPRPAPATPVRDPRDRDPRPRPAPGDSRPRPAPRGDGAEGAVESGGPARGWGRGAEESLAARARDSRPWRRPALLARSPRSRQ